VKIAIPLRTTYSQVERHFRRLAREVNDTLKPRVEERDWFFSSRVKAEESFALKVETGRVPEPASMEDFFACTIIVQTSTQIAEAEDLVYSLYDPSSRKPKLDSSTHKAPYSFEFDDLRLYVLQRDQRNGREEDLIGLMFEIQIKTILQHAWSIATHDLIYKSDTSSWPLQRIAYQAKAMLEHAEVTIAEAESMSSTPSLAKSDRKTQGLLEIITLSKDLWQPEQLPDDVKRLAENLWELLKACDQRPSNLKSIIEAEVSRIGVLPVDLSPYAFTIQALINNWSIDFEQKFKRPHIKTRIAIHDGIEIPESFGKVHDRILVLQ